MGRHLAGCLLALWIILGLSSSTPAATPIGALLGGALACDPANPGCQPFPLNAALLCDGSGANLDCPQFFTPDWAGTSSRFFGLTNRVNPPRCVQSTDGGTTWVLCPTNPYSAALDLFGSAFAVASDGSLIAPADQGTDNCIIRRSTNYGTSWSTVFTDTTAGVTCGIRFAGFAPNVIRCSSTTAYCIVIGTSGGGLTGINYFSLDNGATWTKGPTTFALTSGDPQFQLSMETDASIGVLAPFSVTYGSQTAAVKSGNEYIATSVIPAPPGAGGLSTRCLGTLTKGGDRAILCGPDSVSINTFRLFKVIVLAPTFISNFTLQDAPSFSFGPEFSSFGFNAGTAYVQGRNLATTRLLIYVTRDDFGAVVQIASLTPTTPVSVGCCRGEWHARDSKVYFTNGAQGTQAVFGRIQ